MNLNSARLGTIAPQAVDAAAHAAADAAAHAAASPVPRLSSVYVHFPWCLKKCPYCDFATRNIDAAAIPHDAYADAVAAELAQRLNGQTERQLFSVFFGGGTPSLWHATALGTVLSRIRAGFGSEIEDLEITVECNPTELDARRAADLIDAGVNRLSIGVQSLDEEHLRFLGRRHDAAQALLAVQAAQEVCERVSVDLMFGMAGQSADSLARQVDRLLQLGMRHLSLYALTVEANTPFASLQKRGSLPLASDEGYAAMFEDTAALLESRGLQHYEVSNYAVPSQEARHNQHYWRGGEYLGLGAGAVGCLSEAGGWRRWRNDADPHAYMQRLGGGELAEVFEEQLGVEDLLRERLMLGLRTQRGVDLQSIQAELGIDVVASRRAAIQRHLERGDLQVQTGMLRVPQHRWLWLDGIVASLF